MNSMSLNQRVVVRPRAHVHFPCLFVQALDHQSALALENKKRDDVLERYRETDSVRLTKTKVYSCGCSQRLETYSAP